LLDDVCTFLNRMPIGKELKLYSRREMDIHPRSEASDFSLLYLILQGDPAGLQVGKYQTCQLILDFLLFNYRVKKKTKIFSDLGIELAP